MPTLPILVAAWSLGFCDPGVRGAPCDRADPVTAAATVAGFIADAGSGEPLPGASVALTDLGRAAVTGPDGRYVLRGVPPGPQHLVVTRLGYETRTLHLLVPRVGTLDLDVTLRARPIELEELVVSQPRPVRGVDPADSSAFPERSLSIAALRNHPTLAQPDAFRGLAGGEVVLDPEVATGVHVRGGATDHTAYLLDGVPVLNPYHAAGLFSALNADALSGLRLTAAAPSPALPDALSGVVAATTLEPGDRFRVQGGLSTAEARVTVDGPAPVEGAGYLLSWRSGYPGSLIPNGEPSYLSGETGDLLAGIRAPALGGMLRFLLYDSENEIGTAAVVAQPDSGSAALLDRNRFAWDSRSMGATWSRGAGGREARLTAWMAEADAGSDWGEDGDTTRLASSRRDLGVQGLVRRAAGESVTDLGLRLHRIESAYRAEAPPAPDAPDGVGWSAAGVTTVATLFVQHEGGPGPSLRGRAGVSASVVGGSAYLSPRAQLLWRSAPPLTWTLAYARSHQFSQSLRNPESVVGHVFPADLFIGAGVADVPVPRSDQLVMAVAWRPAAGVRVGVEAYDRTLDHLLLVAPGERRPFATSAASTGSASARGASLELAASGARYGLVASYGWQRVRLQHHDSTYTPRHGTAHVVDAGVVLFPTATSSVRLGATAALGRTATAVAGPFEWEACNLLDQGCEFAGSPRLDGPLGGTRLPAYARLDLGGRKHWHVAVAGRDLLIALFGTVTNVLGRRNTLVYVVDPDTGERAAVEMLPRAPLVVGLDARF